jgi:hypothetical protein
VMGAPIPGSWELLEMQPSGVFPVQTLRFAQWVLPSYLPG